MNLCEKCGSLVPAEKAFCPNCGAAMTPERQRTTELSEEMGETLYDSPPTKNPPPLKPTSPVKKVQDATPSATGSSTSKPPAPKSDRPKAAPPSAPVAGNNRTLRLILVASAALFTLSILVVAVLYAMGKI